MSLDLTAATLTPSELAHWTIPPGATLEARGLHLVITTTGPATLTRPLDIAGRALLLTDVATSDAATITTGSATITTTTPGRQLVRHDGATALHVATTGPAVVALDRLAVLPAPRGAVLDQLAIEVRVQADDGFRLDVDRLGVGRLGQRVPGFRLNSDRLGVGTLGAVATAYTWRDLLPDALSITITRGATVDGITTTTQVGTLAATVKTGPSQPPTLGLRPALPIRLRATATDTTAYTGTVGDLADQFDRGRAVSTTIPAADAVASLASTPRYGATAPETWAGRAYRVMKSALVPWRFAPGSEAVTAPAMSPTVYESTLDNHLQLITNSAAGRWWVDRHGVVVIAATDHPAPVRLRFADTHAPADPLHRCYLDVGIAHDTRATCNTLEFKNHGAAVGANNEWRADDRTLGPFEDITSRATWGIQREEIETCLELSDPKFVPPNTNPAKVLATKYLTGNANPRPRITSVTYDATADIDIACLLDIGDAIDIACRSIRQPSRIVGISHTITPARWTVTLTLVERR